MNLAQGHVAGTDHPYLIPLIVLIGIGFMIWQLRDEDTSPAAIIWMQICFGIIGLLGAKAFSLYVRDWQLLEPASLELSTGWRYPGALIAIIVLLPLLRRLILPRVATLRYFDALALVFGLEVALWRISCYFNGCCVGGHCDASYCLSYPGGTAVFQQQLGQGLIPADAVVSLPVLPLHFLMMLASLSVVLFLAWYSRYRQYNGQLLLLYLFMHEGLKAVLESQREPFIAHLLTTSAIVSVGAMAVLMAFEIMRHGSSAPKENG